ncbi:MAG: chromate transporter [Alphaproteobacteria bacterium]|jgi:chromate transporter|nr:chromate transporter [Alphaproteobacteria bacterium]
MIPKGELFKTFAKIGLLGFGGPAGQIALMHKILVEEKNWISEQRFLHALNYCMLLPGPEAMQLATYIGWLLHKTWGGIIAGLLFVLPGFLLMLGLAAIYAQYHSAPLVAALFFGLKPAVLVIVVEAVIRIGKRALTSPSAKKLAALSFICIFFLNVPFPLIVLGAGIIGYIGRHSAFKPKPPGEKPVGHIPSTIDRMMEEGQLNHASPLYARPLGTLFDWLAIWFTPLLLSYHFLGGSHIVSQVGGAFSKLATVTFGGAYAALAYVAQMELIPPADMLNGLGLAETTPGPLVLVLEYVGYLASYNAHGHLFGVMGAAMAAWVTFAPCFLWIFLGAPYMEQARHNKALAATLSAITAAVTGVVLNLAVWFALHTLFGKVEPLKQTGITLYKVAQPDIAAIALAILAAVTTFKLKWGLLPTLGLCAALGMAIRLV